MTQATDNLRDGLQSQIASLRRQRNHDQNLIRNAVDAGRPVSPEHVRRYNSTLSQLEELAGTGLVSVVADCGIAPVSPLRGDRLIGKLETTIERLGSMKLAEFTEDSQHDMLGLLDFLRGVLKRYERERRGEEILDDLMTQEPTE